MVIHLPRKVCAVAFAALMSAACTHQVTTARAAAPHHHPRTAVASVMTRQVENAVDAGDGDMELHSLRQRLAAHANDLDARILLARLYTRRGYPDVALEHYRVAAAQFPDAAVVVISLAKALRDLDEPEEALRAIATFEAQHAEGNWELLSLEGVLYDEQGDLKRAEAAHRAAVALDGTRGALHNNLGYNLLLQSKPEAAAAEFRRALELDPRSQIAHNNLAEALSTQNKPAAREALSEWSRAEGGAAAHNNLAAVMIEQGRYADARVEIEAALADKPSFPEALANLRLVSDKDGLPTAIHPRPARFWKRVSRGIFGSAQSAPNAAQSAGTGSKGAPARAAEGSAEASAAGPDSDGTKYERQ
jgi:Flp pilus assembly protein TadD